jgi:ketosteroid isomerase-like protein
MTNKEIIQQFYQAFSQGDAEGMVKHYSNDIKFKDPAFGELQGDDVKNMWRMLIRNGKGEIRIIFTDVEANKKTGSANWTAKYVFSRTGRTVVNKIAARFEFQNGKIVRHTDDFDIWEWSKQALGLKGHLLGWTSFMKNKIREYAIASLKKYNASK